MPKGEFDRDVGDRALAHDADERQGWAWGDAGTMCFRTPAEAYEAGHFRASVSELCCR